MNWNDELEDRLCWGVLALAMVLVFGLTLYHLWRLP